MRLSTLLPVFLITLASCSVESRKESSDYPEWEYTKIKKELAAGWNTWDTRSVFTQVWSEEDGMFFCKDLRNGQLVKKMDATNFYPMLCGAGQGDDVDNSDRFYHWGSLLGYINLMEK